MKLASYCSPRRGLACYIYIYISYAMKLASYSSPRQGLACCIYIYIICNEASKLL